MRIATPKSSGDPECGRVSTPGYLTPDRGAWSVFATHPQAERLAVSELTRAGYQAYLPLVAIQRRDPVVKTMIHIVRVPLFSGYGFVWIDGPWVPIRYTSGVRDLLMNGARPATVATSLVEGLRAGDAERCNLVAGALPTFPKGAEVFVSEGPMQGLRAVVLACDGIRTHVNLSMFGRMVAVWMARSALDFSPIPGE